VLKSETCSIAIPELEFEIGGGSLGGRFTTVEGLLNNVQVNRMDCRLYSGSTLGTRIFMDRYIDIKIKLG
jgi:C4-type Zn-finger protein